MGISEIFKSIKDGAYEKVVDFFLKAAIENPAVSKFLMNNKRMIGYIVTVVGLALTEAIKMYPEMALFAAVNPWYVLLSGIILSGIGHVHAESKVRRKVRKHKSS